MIKLIKYKKKVFPDKSFLSRVYFGNSVDVEISQIEQHLKSEAKLIDENSLPILPKISKEKVTRQWEGFYDLNMQDEKQLKRSLHLK